jgi:hypothetical protein
MEWSNSGLLFDRLPLLPHRRLAEIVQSPMS